MSYYEYRVVPAPKSLPKVKGQKSPEGRYSHAMSEALNAEGRDGWEFQRSETIETAVKRGFLSKVRSETLTVLVFRRWVDLDGGLDDHTHEPAMSATEAALPQDVHEMQRQPEPDNYGTAIEEDDTPSRGRTTTFFARRDDGGAQSVPPLRGPTRS